MCHSPSIVIPNKLSCNKEFFFGQTGYVVAGRFVRTYNTKNIIVECTLIQSAQKPCAPMALPTLKISVVICENKSFFYIFLARQ